MGPVAASLPLDDVVWWESRLGGRVWAAPKTAGDGDTGLSYLLYDGHAAVIRKRSVRDQHGREGSTLAHVLVGPAETLGPHQALGLLGWRGWVTDSVAEPGQWPSLEPVTAAELRAASDLSPLRDALTRRPPEQPARLMTAILGRPGSPLAVVGAGQRAAELLCGVLDMIGTGGGPWCTYGTREHDDGDDRQWLVFLAGAAAVSMHGARRSHVRLGDGHDTEADRDVRLFADALTRLYLRDGRDAVDRIRPPSPVRTKDDVRAWMDARTIAPSVLGDVMLVHRAAENDLTGAERDFLNGRQAEQPLHRLLMTAAVPDLIELLERLRNLHRSGRLDAMGETWSRFAARAAMVRCLRDAARSQHPSNDELRLRGVARSSSPEVGVALEAWLSSQDVKAATERLEVLAIAIDLGLDPDPQNATIARLLRLIDAETQVRVVHEANWPQLDHLLISNLTRRRVGLRGRRGVRRAVEQAGLLREAIDRLYPDRPDHAKQRLRYLLGALYGDPIKNPDHVKRLLGAVPGRSRTLAVVLYGLTAPGSRARAALDTELSRWYLDVGPPAHRTAAPRAGAEELRRLGFVTVLLALAMGTIVLALIVVALFGGGLTR